MNIKDIKVYEINSKGSWTLLEGWNFLSSYNIKRQRPTKKNGHHKDARHDNFLLRK